MKTLKQDSKRFTINTLRLVAGSFYKVNFAIKEGTSKPRQQNRYYIQTQFAKTEQGTIKELCQAIINQAHMTNDPITIYVNMSDGTAKELMAYDGNYQLGDIFNI